MLKPVNVWEAIMWASVAVMLVGAVITGVVQGNWRGAWVIFVAAMIILIAAGGNRLVRRRSQD